MAAAGLRGAARGGAGCAGAVLGCRLLGWAQNGAARAPGRAHKSQPATLHTANLLPWPAGPVRSPAGTRPAPAACGCGRCAARKAAGNNQGTPFWGATAGGHCCRNWLLVLLLFNPARSNWQSSLFPVPPARLPVIVLNLLTICMHISLPSTPVTGLMARLERPVQADACSVVHMKVGCCTLLLRPPGPPEPADARLKTNCGKHAGNCDGPLEPRNEALQGEFAGIRGRSAGRALPRSGVRGVPVPPNLPPPRRPGSGGPGRAAGLPDPPPPPPSPPPPPPHARRPAAAPPPRWAAPQRRGRVAQAMQLAPRTAAATALAPACCT